MLEIEMTDDIRKFEPKFVGPLTKRQCVCALIGLVIGVPIGVGLMPSLPLKLAVSLILASPAIACGWIRVSGVYFEVYAARLIYRMFLTPTKRKYKIKNTYREELKAIEKDKKKKRLSTMSKKEQKRYEKEKKQVVYSKKKAYAIHR